LGLFRADARKRTTQAARPCGGGGTYSEAVQDRRIIEGLALPAAADRTEETLHDEVSTVLLWTKQSP
jgi:hypothetical protein